MSSENEEVNKAKTRCYFAMAVILVVTVGIISNISKKVRIVVLIIQSNLSLKKGNDSANIATIKPFGHQLKNGSYFDKNKMANDGQKLRQKPKKLFDEMLKTKTIQLTKNISSSDQTLLANATLDSNKTSLKTNGTLATTSTGLGKFYTLAAFMPLVF